MYCYKRVRDGDTLCYQTSMLPLKDDELEEMTEEEYNSEIAAFIASRQQDEVEDEITEEDLISALVDLGVIE